MACCGFSRYSFVQDGGFIFRGTVIDKHLQFVTLPGFHYPPPVSFAALRLHLILYVAIITRI